MEHMNLIDMKRSMKSETRAVAPGVEDPGYPYGLTISLGTPDLAKLGIAKPPAVGQKMRLEAVTTVSSVSTEGSLMDGKFRVSLQITQMGLCACDDGAVSLLYGKD